MTRLKTSVIILGALLAAAPLRSQGPSPSGHPVDKREPVVDNGVPRWFELNETRAEVTSLLGAPRMVVSLGEDLESWQYQIGVTDEHEFSHQLVFRRSTGRLVSATRTYAEDRDVEWLFVREPGTVFSLANPDGTNYPVRFLRLPDGKLLIVPGSSAKGRPASQIMLIGSADLRLFYPRLAVHLETSQTQQK